jgi:hypothetical protein
MKKMYLVLTSQNGRDTGVPHVAPILPTEDPTKAYRVARAVWESKDSVFVSQVHIYSLELDHQYGLEDFGLKKPKSAIAYISWKNPSCGDEPAILETFNDPLFEKEARQEAVPA